MKHAAAATLLAVALAGCSSPTPSSPLPLPTLNVGSPVVGVSNLSALAVTLTVNGETVATIDPGTAMRPIAFATLPAFPWIVDARSPSGRLLTSMKVDAGYVTIGTDPNGNLGTSFTFGRVDLSCGRITIWAGYSEPLGPAPASPAGSPGDCVP
jgi:hypothetical protein